MKKVPLTRGQFALVDDIDYKRVMKYNWYASKVRNQYYAVRDTYDDGERQMIYLHSFLMPPSLGMEVDHADRNPLNNTRSNLRICTRQENNRNRGMQSNNKCGYKGVFWNKQRNKWMAVLHIDRKVVYIGLYTCLIKAAKAHDVACKEYFGKFACLNFKES